MLQRTIPAGFVAPCLPTKTDKLPSGSQWLHEIKHDGFRIIARKDGDRVRLYSRPGNPACCPLRRPFLGGSWVETSARDRSRAQPFFQCTHLASANCAVLVAPLGNPYMQGESKNKMNTTLTILLLSLLPIAGFALL